MSDVWLGTGLPWTEQLTSYIGPKNDTDILKTSILMILLTRRGERVMLPEFGSNILDLVFEQGDEHAVSAIESEIRSSIGRWDDRIAIDAISSSFDPDAHTLLCKIRFKNRYDPTEETQEMPFELNPNELV